MVKVGFLSILSLLRYFCILTAFLQKFGCEFKKVFPRSSIFLLSQSAVVWVCIIEGAMKEFQGFVANLFVNMK
jgi:hypothetical protein